MKKVLFCFLIVFNCMVIYAQQQPVVAVASFDAISGISVTDANMITRVFFIRLGNTNRVRLVDRNVVDRVIREHHFQVGDWSNENKTAELGKALNADWIVRGELEKFGNNILVTVQFYDIKTFCFMGGADLMLSNSAEAMEKMDPLVNKLVETIASSGSQSKQIGGYVDASKYYGTWIQRRNDKYVSTFIIDSNKVILRDSVGNFVVISNCTWIAENNNDVKNLADYPRGFKIFGTVTDTNNNWVSSKFTPIYIFLNKSDSNRMYFYRSIESTSEIQDNDAWNAGSGPFGKIQ